MCERKYIRPLNQLTKSGSQIVAEAPDQVDYKQMALEVAEKLDARMKLLIQLKMMQLYAYHDERNQATERAKCVLAKMDEVKLAQEQHIEKTKAQYAAFDAEMEKVIAQNKRQLEEDEMQIQARIQYKEEVMQLLQRKAEALEMSRISALRLEEQRVIYENAMKRKHELLQSVANRKDSIEEKKARIQALNNETKLMMQQQRIINNELQEAKGNIRVYCRIRPLISGEDDNLGCVSTSGDCSIQLAVPKNYHKSENFMKNYVFNFEHIFDQESEQNQVYAELSQLIENVIDGHNVCIFAYGQTGSGKTFTMQGQDTFEKRGVIPRAVDHLFKEIKNLSELGWLFKMRVGFQEIYNETIRDLLSNQKTEEIQLAEVSDQTMVYELFRRSMENRKVAETHCNEFSSRSHFIFQLNLVGTNQQASLSKNIKLSQINATLNLIDLAGSERLNQAKTEGDRLKETQCINKSLTALSDVINALAQKSTFVPYRNSKLTHMLQKYLEGSSKTLMLVNVSPRLDDFNQTLQSLRFAEKVKSCKAGNQQPQQQQIKK